MKNLFIIRHATAVPHGSVDDYLRSLDFEANLEIEKMSAIILQKGWLADGILCSSAARTIETAQRLASAFGFDKDFIKTDKMLYNAHFEQYVKTLQVQSDVAGNLVVVGHNPGVSHLATCLANNGKNYSMPTCGLVHLQFKINRWQELSIGSGQVLDFVIP